MEITILLGTVFILLILSCWIIYRRFSQSSVRNAEMKERFHSNLTGSDANENEQDFYDSVELGPVMTADPEDWSPPPFEDEFAGYDSEVREFWGSGYEEEDHADNEVIEVSNDVTATAEEATDTVNTQFTNEDLEAFTEHTEYEYESASSESHEPDWIESSDGLKIEPILGIQADLPLRTTEFAGNGNGATESVIEHVEVDESIQFPEFRDADNQILDMLGWIPANGTAVSHLQLLNLMRSFGAKFDTPVAVYGHLEDSDAWMLLDEENFTSRFTDLIFTMQLTHRGNAIDEQCWWQFFNMGEQIARSLSRPFYPSLSMESALKLSQTLTEQVGKLNIQAIMILLSENGQQLSHRTLEYLAREYQLIMRDDGQIFEKPDLSPHNSIPAFTLTTVLPEQQGDADTEGVGLALYSDLACVRDPLDTFDQMVNLAKGLEDRFPLVLVDETRKKITTRDVAVIRTHIMKFVEDMQFCGIEPGGEKALRLFGEPVVQQFHKEMSQMAELEPKF